jgi:hypothetical protein
MQECKRTATGSLRCSKSCRRKKLLKSAIYMRRCAQASVDIFAMHNMIVIDAGVIIM